MKFGLFDTRTNTWYGDDTGAKIFDSEEPLYQDKAVDPVDGARTMARIAAELVDIRCGFPPHTTIAKEITVAPNRKVGEQETKMSTLKALEKKERGVVP